MALTCGDGGPVVSFPERMSLPIRTVEVQPAKTVSQADFILVGNHRDPYALFDDTPIEEIRRACIKQFRNEHKSGDSWEHHCFWMQNRIEQLMKLRDPLWEDLFQAYLFPLGEPIGVHESALRFAVDLGHRTETHRSAIVKHVAGKVKGRVTWAFKIEELDILWRRVLGRLIPYPDTSYRNYKPDEWYDVERALSVIALSFDTRFTALVKSLLKLHSNSSIRPTGAELFQYGRNQGVLAETYERLQHVTVVRLANLETHILKALGFQEAHMASAEGMIRATCQFPTRTWSPEEPVFFVFHVKTRFPEHLERDIPHLLESISVEWKTSESWKDPLQRGSHPTQVATTFDDDVLRIATTPTKKRNHFSISIVTEGKKQPLETVKGIVENQYA